MQLRATQWNAESIRAWESVDLFESVGMERRENKLFLPDEHLVQGVALVRVNVHWCDATCGPNGVASVTSPLFKTGRKRSGVMQAKRFLVHSNTTGQAAELQVRSRSLLGDSTCIKDYTHLGS